jgi:flagellar hook assembly protein FlgD
MQSRIPLLPLAATTALAIALAGPAAGGIISDVGAIPSPFSPNADGVFDSTAVHYTLSDVAAVSVTVLDSAEVELTTLWSGLEEAGARSHWWDGDLPTGPAPEGAYYFRISADFTGPGSPEVATCGVTIDKTPPGLTGFDVSPTRFSPDGDGVGDSVSIRTVVHQDDPSDGIVLRVLDAGDEPVRTLFSGAAAGSLLVYWDGTGDGGGTVDDGLYYVVAETRDSAGNTDESGALVDADTAPPWVMPSLPDTTIDQWRVDTTVAELSGWAYDRAGVIGVEFSLDGEEWTALATEGADTAFWSMSLPCSTCVSGSVDETIGVMVRARDGVPTAAGVGHVNTSTSDPAILSFDVVFDVAPPLHESSELKDGVTDYYRGQTITITTQWDAGGYEIDADFSGVDSEFDPSGVQVSPSSTGRYTVSYQISGGSTLVPVTNVPVPVSATDYFGRTVTDESVNVNVRAGSAGPSGLSVSANSFNPALGAEVTIGLGVYEGSARVRIYNMAGSLVRTIEVDDASEVVWNGGNDGGDIVASGVYILRIQTDEGEAVRKVAVVK